MAEDKLNIDQQDTDIDDADDKNKMSEEQELVEEAKKRFKLCCDDSSDIRAEALKDLNFIKGDQWDSKILKERSEDRRPALTINKLPTFVNQVVNDARQNRPMIKMRPVDSISDPATAEILNGLVRNIQNNGDYKSAIDSAFYYAVGCGMGFLRVLTDYEDEKSFDQMIKVERIENPMLVYFPLSLIKTADYSDAPYCFIRTSMSKDNFKEQYPDFADSDSDNFTSESLGDGSWETENLIWLAEYFKVEEEEYTLHRLNTGEIIADDELPEVLPEGISIIQSRQTTRRKVKWYLINNKNIIKEKEIPCQYIPVIPVLGQELIVDGDKCLISLVRFARDPQQFYNFFKSMEAEMIALAPKAPWLVADEQIAGYEMDWQASNRKNIAVLKYHSTSYADGRPMPPPQRVDPPAVNMAAAMAMKEANDDIKATTGIFDASLGNKGNESSGKAIIARQRQGDTANYHFVDNLNKALRQLGRIFIDMIPNIYDMPRVIRIVGEDMTDEVVMINKLHNDPKRGDNKLYDLTVGKYDVIVDVGPSYETKRIEAADNLTRIIGVAPQIAQYCSDIIVRNLDFPGAQELADRLKKTLPPQLIENQNPDKISESEVQAIVADLQALQQAHQMSQQQNQALLQTIAQYQALLKDKKDAHDLEMHKTVIKTEAEIQKAQIGLEQEKVRQHGNYVKNAVDAAVDLHKLAKGTDDTFTSIASPAMAQNAMNE